MYTFIHSLLAIALTIPLALAGCGGDDGGGSGLSGSISALSSAEIETLCESTTDLAGGAGETYDCGDGVTIELDTVPECVADVEAFSAGCSATVAQAEECARVSGDDPCDFEAAFSSPACQAVFGCQEQ